MNTILVIILGFIFVIAANVLAIIFFNRRKTEEPLKQDDTALKLLLEQVNEQNRRMDLNLREMTKTMDSKMGENARTMNDSLRSQFGESQKLVREITKELTEVKETGRQVVGFAEQLQSLQDILKNPKQRGILGEYYLETLLKNVLPAGSYKMQYAFSDGTIVDAAVFVRDKIIPVDSKFSLENYNRIIEEKNEAEKEKLEKVFVNDLKNRIAETSKYIQPRENTMDFAFMFIPHEAIYYDLLINKIGAMKGEENENLIQRAASKYHVIIVSPTSFLAYLQTVLQGLKALQIEESAKEIAIKVGELAKHLMAYEEHHVSMGKAITTTVNQYNLSGKEFKKIDKDILRITGETLKVEVIALEKPDTDEE